MGEDEVIKKGEEITNDYVNLFINMDTFTIIVNAVGIIAIIVIMIMSKKMDEFVGGIILSVFILLMITFYTFNIGYKNELMQEIDNVDSWIDEEVEPFIEKLPYETIELESVKLNKDSQTGEYKGFDTWTDVSLNVEYKEKGKKVKDVDKYKVVGIEKGKSYMKYKEVKKDLGYGIDKGKYDKVIYAPMEEIKKWWRY